MPTQDTSTIKEKIIQIIRRKGPSLPVHIAKEIESNILFTSAFLSELVSEKKVKMSHMRVGSSPLYFLQGQEHLIQRSSDYLKSKEKDAFMLLKEKHFLKDSEQEPAIRVALREIKDFATPFKNPESDELFWRLSSIPESEFSKDKIKPLIMETNPIKKEKNQETEEEINTKQDKKEEQLDIFEKEEKISEKEEAIKKKRKVAVKKTKRRAPARTKYDEKFLEKVKGFLSKNQIEIINIEGFKKDELMLKVKVENVEQLLVAYKKKRISEKEIIKSAKKAKELGLKYSLLSMGELPKKTSELINALKDIKEIGKVE